MMKNRIKVAVRLVALLSIIVAFSIGTSILAHQEKEIKHKASNSIDNLIVGCYDDCSGVKPLDYESILADERVEHQLANKAAVKERKVEEDRLAEIARVEAEKERIIRLEQARVAKIKADEERKIRLEKERLAKLEEKKKQPVLASRGNNGGQWISFEATYYGANCYKCSGITALGIDVRNTIHHNGLRVIAVDPNVITLGSTVQVKTPHGTFTAIAGDTGGRIKGHIVDILVESEAVATKYGRHAVELRIVK